MNTPSTQALTDCLRTLIAWLPAELGAEAQKQLFSMLEPTPCTQTTSHAPTAASPDHTTSRPPSENPASTPAKPRRMQANPGCLDHHGEEHDEDQYCKRHPPCVPVSATPASGGGGESSAGSSDTSEPPVPEWVRTVCRGISIEHRTDDDIAAAIAALRANRDWWMERAKAAEACAKALENQCQTTTDSPRSSTPSSSTAPSCSSSSPRADEPPIVAARKDSQ